jgi:hypothetical protein
VAEIRTSELIAGTAGDFIANAHCAFFGRLPDSDGINRYSAFALEHPSARAEALRQMAGESEMSNQNGSPIYIEDEYAHIALDDPHLALWALQRYQLPVLRAGVSRMEHLVRLTSSEIEQSMEEIISQLADNRSMDGRTSADRLDLDLRLARVEKDVEFLRKGFETLRGYVTKEITRNLTEYLVNLIQVQLISIDQRLSVVERKSNGGAT